MKQYQILSLAVLFAGSIFFASCSKEKLGKPIDSASALSVAQDDATSDNLYDDVYNEMDQTVTDLEANNYSANGLKSALTDGSKTISIVQPDTAHFPKTVTITFSNWVDNAGRVKNGKIIINITGRYRVVGSVKTVTLDNFSIDSIKIEGTKTVTNIGRNGAGNLQYEVKLVGGKVTFTDGKVATLEFVKTRTWVAGEITPKFVLDDAYTIEGWANGTNRNGIVFERTITSPLYIAAACPWIAKGTVEITAGDKTMTINYGGVDAVCDNVATVTINGVTKEIRLPRGKKRD
jgi:hypothetical protein